MSESLIKCPNDTDGDGNCHMCKNIDTGCPQRPRLIALALNELLKDPCVAIVHLDHKPEIEIHGITWAVQDGKSIVVLKDK